MKSWCLGYEVKNMSYEENKTNASNIEIIPCERINCKGAAPCVLNINSYMNVYEFEDKIMKYMCNMRPVMDEFICVNLDVIADRPVDFIQSLVEGYIRYDGVHIKKNYRVEYGKMDKEGNNHIYVLEAPDGACDYDMAVSVFAIVCIEGKAPSDWHWQEITEKVFAKKEESTEVMHVEGIDWKEAALLKRKIRRVLGAIVGDIVGSVYEFNEIKTKDFPLFSKESFYTDDSIMTIAVADWLLHGGDLVRVMQYYGSKYPFPMGGYGARFDKWLHEKNPKPYNSWGNGSAMRVSPVGWYFDSLEETINVAEETAVVTHNHPEGIKGAQATASAIYLARKGKSKEYIRSFITDNFGYDLNRCCDDIRCDYKFDESCQGTVPEALIAFLESRSFEDAIRLAVSLGGDSDTLACITGGIAEAFYRYRIPYGIRSKVLSLLDDDLRRIVKEFIDARREWFIHPRWEEDGESISIVVSEPSKEEVEKLKTESVRLILNSLNSETDEKKE